ncbi:MAG: hypothetical protein J7623_05770 [Chitinophaga sp.]|uniref:hypothetical protein n=1 Tax=Chitinophaga sp. TaxID=1869181 RepID=UPI001B2BDBD8|nr:hypothetical protein [Chitinophaga sp.]MBO9728129.1 hypothetical protein [Chitinophaga sp.]
MKPRLYAVLLCSAAFAMSSCNKHIYVPNQVNAPLLKERYEFKGSVTPTNLQTAFAVTDNIGIMANGQYLYGFNYLDPANDNSNDNNDILVSNRTRGGLVEGAVGYFKPFGSRKKMVFDVYAGYGSGGFKTFTHRPDANDGTNINDYMLKNHFSKVFVQPSIGFVNPVVETIFTSRFSMVNFYNSQFGTKAFENDENGKTDFLRINNKPIAFYEPAFTVRVGYKYVKFQSQLQFSVPLNDESFNNYGANNYNVNRYFQQVTFTMGVAVNIAHWYDDMKRKRD